MNEEQMRAEFEDWWANFQSEHEEWKYADREAILFQAWQAALFSQSAKSGHDYASMVVMEFNGERVPQFSQGYQSHELLEVVTAERCQQLVKLIDAAPQPTDDRVRELEKDAARYRWLRNGAHDEVAVVCGLGAMDYGMSAVVYTYSEEIDGDDLDTFIDAMLAARIEK